MQNMNKREQDKIYYEGFSEATYMITKAWQDQIYICIREKRDFREDPLVKVLTRITTPILKRAGELYEAQNN